MIQRKTIPNPQRTIDAIYLTVKFKKNQGGYVVLGFKSGLTIPSRKVNDIPFKTMVIKYLGNMVADNKITTLNIENKSEVLLHTNLWLAGVMRIKMGMKAKI